MMKRVLVVLALAVSVSARASAFAPKSSTMSSAAKVGKPAAPSAVVARLPDKTAALTQTSLRLSSGAAEAAPESSSGAMETLKVGSYFGLWYLFNIAYNIYNKQALNALDFPWTIATIQMAAGMLYFVPLWILGIRKAPQLSMSEIGMLVPSALCHTGVHVGAVIALGAGAVSFAHIVKASEPVVSCVLNAVLMGEVLSLNVYMTLIPIIAGVGIASMKELSFTYLALGAAMLSNVSSAARGVLSKKTMSGSDLGKKLDPQNMYAVLTTISTFLLIPMMLATEGTAFLDAFKAVVSKGTFTQSALSKLLLLSGVTYYAYNEVAFLALGKVNPVTHAVGNTIKRVVIIIASVIAFKTPMSTGSIIGSSIAISGTLMYSLAMNKFKAAKKAAAAAAEGN